MSEEQQVEFGKLVEQVNLDPQNDQSWQDLELLASQLDKQDEVASVYNSLLSGTISAENAILLGQQAAQYHEEWFGDESEGLANILSQVLHTAPKNEWAFQQLTVVLTVAERWDDLIKLYENIIAQTSSKAEKIGLLDEAYQVTKDLANRPERAISFLQEMIALKPNAKQEQALQRLLERHSRWDDLIELWKQALPTQTSKEKSTTYTCIATTYFEKLNDASQALETIRLALIETPESEPAITLLAQMAVAPSIKNEQRTNILHTVRKVYELSGRSDDLISVLSEVLPLSNEEERKALHAELGGLLAGLEEHAAALDHYAALLLLDPSSVAAQRALRREAQLTDKLDRYATALASAAESKTTPKRRVSLLSDAATVQLEVLNNETSAIDLLLNALDTQDIQASDILQVGKQLNLLLECADRRQERLVILEKLANAETVESSQRALIGDVAGLAEELGEIDQALAAWQRRLSADPTDLRALSSFIKLLEKDSRWSDLIQALTNRLQQEVPENQKHSDLEQMAHVYETELRQSHKALEIWQRIHSDYGESPQVIESLSRLMKQLGHWSELTELLENSNARQMGHIANQFAQLGQAYKNSMNDENKAIECYQRALSINQSHEMARDGLIELLNDPKTRNQAAEALVYSLQSTGDHVRLLEIVDARIEGSDDPRKHAEVLREAADIAEHHNNDVLAAFNFITRLFPIEPRDRELEEKLVELAKKTNQWQACWASFELAQEALQTDSYARAQMRFREAVIREEETSERDAALNTCLQVIAALPGNHGAVSMAIRLAGLEKRYHEMVATFLAFAAERDTVPKDLMSLMASHVDNDDWSPVCNTLSQQLDSLQLSPRHKAELYWQVAKWLLSNTDDEKAALHALQSSVREDKSRIDTLTKLIELQEPYKDENLLHSLRRLCELDDSSLQPFIAAAELSLEFNDAEIQRQSLMALQSRTISAWRGFSPAQSRETPEEIIKWTISELETLFIETDEAQRALDILLDARQLPFSNQTQLELRTRAARIAVEELKNNSCAIDMYRSVLALKPGDDTAMQALAKLYKEEKRIPESLALKQQALALSVDKELTLSLRLEIVELIQNIDEDGGRKDLYLANLEQQPGHEKSIQSVIAYLSDLNKFQELVRILTEQANVLEKQDEISQAARLWQQIAELQEREIQDIEAALLAYRKVAVMEPNLSTLEALARLHMAREQSEAAVPWLEQGINLATAEELPRLVLKLAEAHVATQDDDLALACLSQATDNSNLALVEIRKMKATLHRKKEQWNDLASTLTASLPHIVEKDLRTKAAREAATLYHQQLNQPELAVIALSEALQLLSGDRNLRLMMARSQRFAGNLAEARQYLEDLIKEFGRRRSKERAAAHVELAQVERAEGKLDIAMKELELASKMDVGNPMILRSLASLSSEQGDLNQAERSLRALRLIIPRRPPGDDENAVGISEVLFELYHIATIKEDAEKAEELLESMTDSATASDLEMRRLRRTLLEKKEFELLSGILRTRVSMADEAASKSEMLKYLANLQNCHLDDPNAALETILESLAFSPIDESLHKRARELAIELHKSETYHVCLESLIAQQRRSEESGDTVTLLMRAGCIAELDLENLDQARIHYTAAENCPSSPIEALLALARITGKQGDQQEQTRVLDELTQRATSDGSKKVKSDAFYMLAEIQVEQLSLLDRGLELLEKAIEMDPRYRKAALILEIASETSNNAEEVLQRYESAARLSGDKTCILNFLERSIGDYPDETKVQEAVSIAIELEQEDRAAQLLSNLVTWARNSEDGVAHVDWAVLQLSLLLSTAGNVSEAKALLFEVASISSQDRVIQGGLHIAQDAMNLQENTLAAEVLEFLSPLAVGERQIWSMLISVYKELKEDEKLVALIESTLPLIVSSEERCDLRIIEAKILIDRKDDDNAILLLKEACMEGPDNLEAAALLEQVLRKEGNEDALKDFLWQRFTDAKQRGEKTTITDTAHRLGKLLDSIEEPSLDVYQQALEYCPEDTELLRCVLEQTNCEEDPEREADLMERLLKVSPEEEKNRLAVTLIEKREALQNQDDIQRSLELAFQACPTHHGIRLRLEEWYENTLQWTKLAELKTELAEKQEPPEKITLLREAARIYKECLNNPEKSIAILELALQSVPHDTDLALQLAILLEEEDRIPESTKQLESSIAHAPENRVVELRELRARLLQKTNRQEEAVQELEAAFLIDPKQVEESLLKALYGKKQEAEEEEDRDSDFQATMRIIELLEQKNCMEEMRKELASWIERDPLDAKALYRLQKLDTEAGNWEAVVNTAMHLIGIESGQAQIDSALCLAEAAAKLETENKSLEGLKQVHEAQPDNQQIRDILKNRYQEAEYYEELANLLLLEADTSTDVKEKYETYIEVAAIFMDKLDNPQAALRPVQEAKKLQPEAHETIVMLADLLISSGNGPEASEVITPAIARHKRRSPDLAVLQYKMAQIAQITGDQDTQLEWLKKSFDVDRKNGVIAAELAHLATERGDYELALKPLRAITLLKDPGPVSRVTALLWEAKIEHARGNRAKAELWAKKALREDPSYTEAEEFLAELTG